MTSSESSHSVTRLFPTLVVGHYEGTFVSGNDISVKSWSCHMRICPRTFEYIGSYSRIMVLELVGFTVLAGAVHLESLEFSATFWHSCVLTPYNWIDKLADKNFCYLIPIASSFDNKVLEVTQVTAFDLNHYGTILKRNYSHYSPMGIIRGQLSYIQCITNWQWLHALRWSICCTAGSL